MDSREHCRRSTRRRVTALLGILSLCVAVASCGWTERAVQQEWIADLWDPLAVVRAFAGAEGRLPENLEELDSFMEMRRTENELLYISMGEIEVGGGRSVETREWIHYRKESEKEAVLFLCREEIRSDFDGSVRCAEEGRPRDGDVYLRVNEAGELVYQSARPGDE